MKLCATCSSEADYNMFTNSLEKVLQKRGYPQQVLQKPQYSQYQRILQMEKHAARDKKK